MTNHLLWGILGATLLILVWLFVGKKDMRDSLLTVVGLALELLIVLSWNSIVQVSRLLYGKLVFLLRSQASTGTTGAGSIHTPSHTLLHTTSHTLLYSSQHAVASHAGTLTSLAKSVAAPFLPLFLHTLVLIGESIVAEIVGLILLASILLVMTRRHNHTSSILDDPVACWQCEQQEALQWYALPGSSGQATIPLCSDCAARMYTARQVEAHATR